MPLLSMSDPPTSGPANPANNSGPFTTTAPLPAGAEQCKSPEHCNRGWSENHRHRQSLTPEDEMMKMDE